jgi:hypothetical protein
VRRRPPLLRAVLDAARFATLGLCLGFAAGPAFAHKPSDSYLTITQAQGQLGGRWDIALRDLEYAIGLDADGDGAITWGELRARHADIAAYALARLGIEADGNACSLRAGAQQVEEHSDGMYTVLPLAIDCPRSPDRLTLRYTLFGDLDPQHRGLLKLAAGGATRSAVLAPGGTAQTFELAQASGWAAFVDFVREGVWHIWIGFDHILFLLSLLLPAVLVWRARAWQPAPDFRSTFWDVFRVVTSFTVAHSITLTLAALDVVRLPSRWVESAIAASVVVAALNNLRPIVLRRRWVVAFGFGLIHGFGFASVLADLGLPRAAMALALAGFNVGVELGQLAIVGLFLPLAYALRRTALYRRWVMAGGSLAIALLAALWLAERAFDIKLLSR